VARDLYYIRPEGYKTMKGFLIAVMLLTGITGFANTPDTTVTSFEIHLKRKSSDNSLGFNTCTVDRLKLYNTVMQQIKGKISAEQFSSLHQPLVLLKFQEYISEKGQHPDEISYAEAQSLKGHKYNYFVKIYGNLKASTPLNPFEKASFTLKVCVFDSNGRLIAKGRSKSRGKDIAALTTNEDATMSEQQFLELVTDAATELNLSI
jgi:hypothetical protein